MPPSVATVTVFAPTTAVAGTVNVTEVALLTVTTVAATAPTLTVIAAADGLAEGLRKYVPVIVTESPANADVLSNDVIVGAASFVNALPSLEPPSVVTTTGASPTVVLIAVPAGTTSTAFTAVGVKVATGVAATPPIVNVPPPMLVPVTVTTSPALALAVTVVTVGGW